jgi:hypothetical protein
MKLIILVGFALLYLPLYAQVTQKTPGYLGRKIVVELSSKVSTPVFRKQYVTNYANNQFIVKQKFIDVALLASCSYTLKRNVMFGATLGYGRFRADIIGGGKIDTDTNSFTDEIELLSSIPNPIGTGVMPALQAIPFEIFSFVPKVEFAGKGALLPMGLFHSIGIGLMSIRPDKRSVAGYTRGVTSSGGQAEKVFSTDVQQLINPSNKSLLVLTLQYSMNMRMPINDRMMFNFGVLYTGNIFKDARKESFAPTTQKEVRDYFISRDNYVNTVRSRVQTNFISFTTGISVLF